MNYARQEDKPFRMLAAFVAVMVGLILARAAIPAHAQTYKLENDAPGDGANRQRADRSGDRQDHNQDPGRIVCK